MAELMDMKAPEGGDPAIFKTTTPATARSRNMGIAPLSILLLLIASIWHISEAYYFGMPLKNHMTASMLSLLFGILGLFMTLPGKGEFMDYLNTLLERNRNRLIGISAAVIGGMHFLTFSGATDVVPMFGYVILLIAYYELGSLAIRTGPYLAHANASNTGNNAGESTRRFIRYSGSKILIALGLTFAMSTFMLFISFMGIVGFTGVWTVLILSALLMASLGMIVRSSNI